MRKIILKSQGYGWPDEVREVPEFGTDVEARLAHYNEGLCFIGGRLHEAQRHGSAQNPMHTTYADVHEWWGWKPAED